MRNNIKEKRLAGAINHCDAIGNLASMSGRNVTSKVLPHQIFVSISQYKVEMPRMLNF